MSLPPYFHHTADFGLDILTGGFEGNGGGFSDDWGKCNEIVIFPPYFGLLDDFVGEINQVQSFVGTRVLQSLKPYFSGSVCMSPG